jgi:hypothetical protein
MPSFAVNQELRGLLGAGRNLFRGAGLFIGPELFQQGRSGSLVDRTVQNLPGIVPDPRTDVGRNLGNRLGNEFQYIINRLGRGLIPYTQNMSGQTPLSRRNRYGGSGDMDAEPGLVSKINDPSQEDYIAPPSAPISPPLSNLPPEERAYQAELARTQQMMASNPYMPQTQLYAQGQSVMQTPEDMASNPYMPQTQLYAQGQSVMQTPEDMAATRDLGLAINRAMYGNQLAPKTPNPLMAGLTPPSGAQPNISIDQERRIGQIDAAYSRRSKSSAHDSLRRRN